jgi:hypothetical protein
MTREERIAKIRGGRWIRYPLADRIAAKLEELLLLPKAHRMPNLLIVGETNNGKTAMLSRFVRQHPPRESDGGEVASGIPVIAMEAPPVAASMPRSCDRSSLRFGPRSPWASCNTKCCACSRPSRSPAHH